MPDQGFTLTSPAFRSDGPIPRSATCDGENTSPQLEWIHPPDGTRSFALIVDDPDAPHGTFTHWVLFDIPPNATGLPARASNIGISGVNDFRHAGYRGPCPPPNHGEHRYFFKLFALDVDSLNMQADAPREDVEAAMRGHILNQAELMGRYERRTG